MAERRRPSSQKSQILALRNAASAINSGGDLMTVLQQLVSAACNHANWTLGSIMAIDVAHGFAHVIVRHDPTLVRRPLTDRWDLAMSPSLLALKRNEPVYIRDARVAEEFPGYRQEAAERDYRTVLVMPMTCLDDEGRAMVLSVVAREIRDVTETDLAFLGMIVHLGAITVERQHRLRDERLAAERLQKVLQSHTSLLQQVLSDGSLQQLAVQLNELLSNPIVVVDFTTNLLVAGRSPDLAVYDDVAWRAACNTMLGQQLVKAARDAADGRGGDVSRLFLDDGTNRLRISAKFEPLTVDGEAVGALIIFPTSREFSDLDVLLLDSAKLAFSALMMRSLIRFRVETRTLTELFLEIVEGRWRDADDLSQRAYRLGIHLDVTVRMVAIEFSQSKARRVSASIDLHHAVTGLLSQLKVKATVISVKGGLVCLLAGDGSNDEGRIRLLMERISTTLSRTVGEEPIIVLSSQCRALADYGPAWERCGRMIGIARSFGRSGAITGTDFGPLPMLAAAADAAEVRGFVHGAVGEMIAHDEAHGTSYLETLSAYVNSGCRSRACAEAMGLHVTSLRYRLSRIQDLFAVEVNTPDKRFAVELAIRLHHMMGRSRPPGKVAVEGI